MTTSALCLLVAMAAVQLDAASKPEHSLLMQRCQSSNMTGAVKTDVSMYEDDQSIRSRHAARSLLDCVDLCLEDNLCHSAFYYGDSSHKHSMYYMKRCYLLGYWNAMSSGSSRVITGQMVEIDPVSSRDIPDVCSGYSCPNNTTCQVYCNPENSNDPYPYCIADNSNCDVMEEYLNMRHYYAHRYTDETDDGVFQQVYYNKIRDDTRLRVNFLTSLLGHNEVADQCKRFFITFDGHECGNPHPIDWVTYSSQTGDMRRNANIDGTCDDLAAGVIKIEMRIGACPNYGDNDGQVGWKTSRQMTVMEIVPRPSSSKPCPGMAVFNYAYTSQLHATNYHAYNQTVFTADSYNKLASDTSLRIKFQANMGSEMHSPTIHCSRWMIYIDSSECSPIGEVIIHTTGENCWDYHRDDRKHYTLEALCTGISTGSHTVTIRTRMCHHPSSNEPSWWSTGWNSYSRMHIEEVRTTPLLDGMITSDGTVLKNPFQNMERRHLWLNDNAGDNEILYTMEYTKQHSYTALRLTASGGHQTYFHPGHATYDFGCSRWFFYIDDSDCSDPGYIEGVSYFNYWTNFHHPMQVSGICNGVAKGIRRITYRVGPCEGESQYGDAHTAWGSSFHIFMEEVNLESITTCQSGRPVVCNV